MRQGEHLNWRFQITVGLVIILLLALIDIWFFNESTTPTSKSLTVSPFVTRSGNNLVFQGKIFRFSGANIYWLGLQENPSVSYPSHFTVDDALATAALMGDTVVRSHTLGISTGCSLCLEPSLGQFNQVALQHIDYAIQSARIHHIKLIIPLTDNWHYYHGGKHNFTDWRGLSDENQFYYDPQVIDDFKRYINVLLNHVNRYNGIAYKMDPTILAWETGNELLAPSSWVQSIANYIKSIDSHHLVMDGNTMQDQKSSGYLHDLKIKAVDIYTDHYYPPNISTFQIESHLVSDTGKVFIVGEFDWNTNQGDSLSNFLYAVQHSTAAGDMYWSLFSHYDTYGYIQHQEHYTLHYPGDTPDMRKRVSLLRTHAYAMQGLPIPTINALGVPLITLVQGNMIAWRGVAGVYTYTIERSAVSPSGPWAIVCDRCATDNDTPWVDSSKPLGPVWYRVRGYTISDVVSPYSNIYRSIE